MAPNIDTSTTQHRQHQQQQQQQQHNDEASTVGEEGMPVRHLMYDHDCHTHWQVLTRVYGSVWGKVLPFCLANVVVTLIVYGLKRYLDVDLTSDISGHKYAGVMMAFLVITRLKITVGNYMANAGYLQSCYKACQEIAQYTCMLTGSDQSNRAKQWRHDVIYATIILLRVTMAVLEFRSSPHLNPWDVPELDQEQQDDIKRNTFLRQSVMNINVNAINSVVPAPVQRTQSHESQQSAASSAASVSSSVFSAFNNMASPRALAQFDIKERSKQEEAYRAPIVLSYNVRREIMKQRDGTWLAPGTFLHPCNEELKIMDLVGDFLKAYHGLKKYMTNPIPFPLVQMSKTFLFVWVFTLSFALCHMEWHLSELLTIVFLITYGFVGLELVAMELHDCFGDDPVDLDNLGRAQIVFEDCYIAVYKQDGGAWASHLRDKVSGRLRRGNALDLFRKTYADDWCGSQHIQLDEALNGEANSDDESNNMAAAGHRESPRRKRFLGLGMRFNRGRRK